MQLAKLRKNPRRIHVTPDGVKTVCGAFIPDDATLSRETDVWYKHTNCYNCTYRLWATHKPTGYIRPVNGKDFPLRQECPHYPGREVPPKTCQTCTPFNPALARPCPKGCPEPHDPRLGNPPCTVYPTRRPVPEGGKCVDGCESEDALMHR